MHHFPTPPRARLAQMIWLARKVPRPGRQSWRLAGSASARGRAAFGEAGLAASCLRRGLVIVFASTILTATAIGADAEDLADALTKAYFNNPGLNAARAAVRASDENVPIAMTAERPHMAGSLDLGLAHINPVGVSVADAYVDSGAGSASASLDRSSSSRRIRDVTSAPRGLAIGIDQNIFDGLRTANRARAAETGVFGERETLRLTEQNVLQTGCEAYMNVLRDTAALDLRIHDIKLLELRLEEARERLRVSDVTPTDVAQVEARLAGSRAAYSAAQANLQNSIASFRQVIGEQPNRLAPAQPLTRGVPDSLENAIAISQVEHPSVQAARFAIDRAELHVKIAEGGLYPTVAARGSTDRHDDSDGVPGRQMSVVSAELRISVPLYQGGAEYAAVRRAKEQLAVVEARADVQRGNVEAAVVSAWGLLVSSKAAIQASRLEIAANEIVILGMREERRVGERTMLEILDAQQALLQARISLIRAQRDETVASCAVLGSTGRLSASTIGLKLRPYDPTRHFDQVKDKWFGLRTPDGR